MTKKLLNDVTYKCAKWYQALWADWGWGLKCNHPSSVVCPIFWEQLPNTNEVTGENSMLIQVSVLNQQYLIILMYVINIIQIFQAESIEAIYFELEIMKYFCLAELRFLISSSRWTCLFLLVCLGVFGERRNSLQNHIAGSHQYLSTALTLLTFRHIEWSYSFSFLFYTSVKIEKAVIHLWKISIAKQMLIQRYIQKVLLHSVLNSFLKAKCPNTDTGI